MKLFIDSADLNEIKQVANFGILEGVTTNPSLIKKAVEKLKAQNKSISLEDYIGELLRTAAKIPVSLEVVGSNYEDMLREGLLLFKKFNVISNNVYIKVPINPGLKSKDNTADGIKTIKELSKQNIPVNCTLIFTPEQALLAAKAGASFVSPFAGRVDDFIRDKNNIEYGKEEYFPINGIQKDNQTLHDNGIVSGVDLVKKCVNIFQKFGIKTQVLAASLRNIRQFRDVAEVGADIATVPFDVINELLTHPKTAEGMKQFTQDIVPEYAEIFEEK